MTLARGPATRPAVAVIVLNWNRWRDTIENLESVLRLDYPNLAVIVCDNDSTDGSVEKIEAWAKGEMAAPVAHAQMAAYTMPPLAKPVDFVRISCSEVDHGHRSMPRVTLIETGANLGYAGGNNVGLRYALNQGFAYFWLLNDDTVVPPDALKPLVERLERDSHVGLCGSTLRYYAAPDVNQELGGCAYYPLLGMARRLGSDTPASDAIDAQAVERRLGFVSGAAAFVSRPFLEDVGLMCEDYFLYCEEIDWATRARGRYHLAYAPDSIVYHKKGASIGSKTLSRRRSADSSYYLWRARFMFTRRFYPFGLPGLSVFAFFALLNAGFRLDGKTANALMRAVRDGLGRRV